MSWWWPFEKRQTLVESGIFQGMIDYHSHLLPGVDDGVQTPKESLEILRLYETLGVCEVWFTPHIMEDIPNTTVGLRSRFEQFQRFYTGNIRLHLAAEYMLDNLFKERLSHRDLLPLGVEGNYLLVETSYFNPPMDMYGMVEKIKSAGFIPVLAHPERYIYMEEADYLRLKEMGVKFQSNIPSLVGCYGKKATQNLRFLVTHSFIDVWGTDTHRLQSWHEVTMLSGQFSEILIKHTL